MTTDLEGDTGGLERGWYLNADDVTQERYWNGEEWTRTRRVNNPPTEGSDDPPAGWYPDPSQVDTQRYWTGTEWTEQRAPLAQARKAGDQDLTFGILLGIAIPIVGIIYGIFVLLKGNGNGGWIIVVSLLAIPFWILLLVFLAGFGSGLGGS